MTHVPFIRYAVANHRRGMTTWAILNIFNRRNFDDCAIFFYFHINNFYFWKIQEFIDILKWHLSNLICFLCWNSKHNRLADVFHLFSLFTIFIYIKSTMDFGVDPLKERLIWN